MVDIELKQRWYHALTKTPLNATLQGMGFPRHRTLISRPFSDRNISHCATFGSLIVLFVEFVAVLAVAFAYQAPGVACVGLPFGELFGGIGRRNVLQASSASPECVDGDLHLVRDAGSVVITAAPADGTPAGGVIIFCRNGRWSVLQKMSSSNTDTSNFGPQEALVVCRQLGWSSGVTVLDAGSKFGGSVTAPPVVMLAANLDCTGSEVRLADCTITDYNPSALVNGTTRNDTLGAYCESAGTEGELRLIPGADGSRRPASSNATYGLLQMFRSGNWASIHPSDTGASPMMGSSQIARVACRQLGWATGLLTRIYLGGGAPGLTAPAFGPLISLALTCNGTESHVLNECLLSRSSFDDLDVSQGYSYSTVALECRDTIECTIGDLRLVNGSSGGVPVAAANSSAVRAGILQICPTGMWASLVNPLDLSLTNFFSNQAALVACRQLGWPTGVLVHMAGTIFGGSVLQNPVLDDNFYCLGSEANLLSECTPESRGDYRYDAARYNWFNSNSTMGVSCDVAQCTDGDVRLLKNRGNTTITAAPADSAPTVGVINFCKDGVWNVLIEYSSVFSNDAYFNSKVGLAVCRQLGWGTGVVIRSAWSKIGGASYSPPVGMLVANLSCTGTEARLPECSITDLGQHFKGSLSAGNYGMYDISIGVYCESVGVEGQLRLIPEPGGTGVAGSQFGVLQMFYSGIWVHFEPDHQFNSDLVQRSQTAKVACRQLGWATGYVAATVGALATTPLYGPVIRLSFTCNGTETHLLNECSHGAAGDVAIPDLSVGDVQDWSHDAAAVECRNATECTVGDLRLVNGSSSGGAPVVPTNGSAVRAGILQVCLAGLWATLDSRVFLNAYYLNPRVAWAACRQLGWPTGVLVNTSGTVFGGGVQGPVMYVDFRCTTGVETRLLSQCAAANYFLAVYDFDGSRTNSTIGISCNAPVCTDGELRLVNNGSVIITAAPADGSPAGGAIVFCKDGRWNVLHDNNNAAYFGLEEALVACRQMGWSTGVAVRNAGSKFGGGVAMSVNMFNGNVNCSGSEARLADCTIADFNLGDTTNGTSVNDIIGAYCESAGVQGQLRLVPEEGGSGLPGSQYGILQMFYSGHWVALDPYDAHILSSTLVREWETARVACRQLGWVTGYMSPNYLTPTTPVYGPVVRLGLACNGTEAYLLDECSHTTAVSSVVVSDVSEAPFSAIALECRNATECPAGEIRLVNGSSSGGAPIVAADGSNVRAGVLQICPAEIWVTLSSLAMINMTNYLFDDRAASAACRQLGWPSGVRVSESGALFGGSIQGPVLSLGFACFGNETGLLSSQCPDVYDGVGEFNGASTNATVGLSCDDPQCTDGNLQLVSNGGNVTISAAPADGSPGSGVVVFCKNGRWSVFSSVAANYFGSEEVSVICRQLGWGAGVPVYNAGSKLGGGVTAPPVSMLNVSVNCSGTEARLADCPSTDLSTSGVVTNGTGQNNTIGAYCAAAACTDGDVRLVYDGRWVITAAPADGSPTGGVILICRSGTWSVLKDPANPVNIKAALVVCRQLGWSAGVAVADSGSKFGGGVVLPPVVMLWVSVNCSGSEARLADCTMTDYNPGVTIDGSGRNDVLGAYCDTAGVDGQLRLIPEAGGSGLPGSQYGIVEMFYSGYWSTLLLTENTSSLVGSWQMAKVACRQLGWATGFKATPPPPSGVVTPVYGPLVRLEVACNGTEAHLLNECRLVTGGPTSMLDSSAGYTGYFFTVECRNATQCQDGDIRLVNGSADASPVVATNPSAGILQICPAGIWATLMSRDDIYNAFYGNQEALVTCSQLGWPTGTMVRSAGEVFGGAVQGPVLYSDFNCFGSEARLLSECTAGADPTVISNGNNITTTIGVSCGGAQCTDGEVRLVSDGGSTVIAAAPADGAPGGGVLQFCKEGRWNTIVNVIVDSRNEKIMYTEAARVACRQLGWGTGVAVHDAGFKFGGGPTAPVALLAVNVTCTGAETRLVDCKMTDYSRLYKPDMTMMGMDIVSRTVGAYCDQAGLEGQLRLIPEPGGSGQPGSQFGALQMYYSGYWMSIDFFGFYHDSDLSLFQKSQTARVACRQLGWATGLMAFVPTIVTPLFGPLVRLKNLLCNGTEGHLLGQCSLGSPVVDMVTLDVALSTTYYRSYFPVALECRNASECTAGSDLRLVNGSSGGTPVVAANSSTVRAGILQICPAGIWETLSSSERYYSDFGSQQAWTVCKQLGWPTGSTVNESGAVFGGGVLGPLLGVSFLCRGNETRLLSQCTAPYLSIDVVQMDGSSTNSTLGISCDVAQCADGDVRLAHDGGSVTITAAPADGAPAGGVLLLCKDGRWNVLYNYNYSPYFGPNAARVACRQMGWSSGVPVFGAGVEFGGGLAASVNMLYASFTCTGSETRLGDCALTEFYPGITTNGTGRNDTIGVYCNNTGAAPSCTDGDVRLVRDGGGITITVAPADGAAAGGVVLFCKDGQWNVFQQAYSPTGALNDSPPLKFARVVCRQLGWSTGTIVNGAAGYAFGGGVMTTSPLNMVVGYAVCNGSEARLAECTIVDLSNFNPIFASMNGTGRNDTTGVYCESAGSEGQLRLIPEPGGSGLPGSIFGILQMFYFGHWVTLSDLSRDSFTLMGDWQPAKVACRQLGWATGFMTNIGVHETAPAYGPLVHLGFSCNGTEAHLLNACSFTLAANNGDILNFGRDYNPGRSSLEMDYIPGTECRSALECTDGDLRLVNGSASGGAPVVAANRSTVRAGILQVCPAGIWVNLVDSDPSYFLFNEPMEYSNMLASIACRQMGWPSGTMVQQSGTMFGGSVQGPLLAAPFTFDGCDGSTGAGLLFKCHARSYYYFASMNGNTSNATMGIICDTPVCTDGELRLVKNGTMITTAAPPDGAPAGGVIMFCKDGRWNVFADDRQSYSSKYGYFGHEVALVVCRQLGWGTGVIVNGAGGPKFGGGVAAPVTMLVASVNCTGSEARLEDCYMAFDSSSSYTVSSINYNDTTSTIGAYCESAGVESQVRLIPAAGGSGLQGSHFGILQMFYSGHWSTVNLKSSEYSSFIPSFQIAKVACRQFGWAAASYLAGALRVQTTAPMFGPLISLDLACNGTEDHLMECSHAYSSYTIDRDISTSYVIAYAALECREASECTVGDLRLVNGSSSRGAQPLTAADNSTMRAGTLQICPAGIWATLYSSYSYVYGSYFDDRAASTACRQLGWPSGGVAVNDSGAFFGGSVQGPLLSVRFNCSGGDEAMLLRQCASYLRDDVQSSNGLGINYTVGVSCSAGPPVPTTCTEGDVRLVSNDSSTVAVAPADGTPLHGVIIYCKGGRWKLVVDDLRAYAIGENYFGSEEALVVCRQLGWSTGNPVHFSGPQANGGNLTVASGLPTSETIVADVRCTGSEARFADCPVTVYEWDDGGIRRNDAVGVHCGVTRLYRDDVNGSQGLETSSVLSPINFNGSSDAVTTITATALAAAAAASITASVAGSMAAAAGSGGGSAAAAAASGIGGVGAVQAATALTTFLSHMQFFPLTSTASANLSANYLEVNTNLRWVILVSRKADVHSRLAAAYSQVVISSVLMAAVLLVHWLIFYVYGKLHWLSRVGVPSLLVVPFLEMVVARIALVPLANAATVLLAVGAGTGRPLPLVLGALVVPFLLSYLITITWAVVRIHTGRFKLGLMYERGTRGTVAATGTQLKCTSQPQGPTTTAGASMTSTTPANSSHAVVKLGVRPLRDAAIMRLWDKLNLGHWNRPTGEEIRAAKLESHLTRHYVNTGVSLRAAARCLYPKAATAAAAPSDSTSTTASGGAGGQDNKQAQAADPVAAPEITISASGAVTSQTALPAGMRRVVMSYSNTLSPLAAGTTPAPATSATVRPPPPPVRWSTAEAVNSGSSVCEGRPAVIANIKAADTGTSAGLQAHSARHRQQQTTTAEGRPSSLGMQQRNADTSLGLDRAGTSNSVGGFCYDSAMLLPPPPLPPPPPPPPAPPPILPALRITTPAQPRSPAECQSPPQRRSPKTDESSNYLDRQLLADITSWDSCSSYTQQQPHALLATAAATAHNGSGNDYTARQPSGRPKVAITAVISPGLVDTVRLLVPAASTSNVCLRRDGLGSSSLSRGGRDADGAGNNADAVSDAVDDDPDRESYVAWSSPTLKAATPYSMARVWTFNNAYMDVDPIGRASVDREKGSGGDDMLTFLDAAATANAAVRDGADALKQSASSPTSAAGAAQSQNFIPQPADSVLSHHKWSTSVQPYTPSPLRPLIGPGTGNPMYRQQAAAGGGLPPLGSRAGDANSGSNNSFSRCWSSDAQQSQRPGRVRPPWRYSLGQEPRCTPSAATAAATSIFLGADVVAEEGVAVVNNTLPGTSLGVRNSSSAGGSAADGSCGAHGVAASGAVTASAAGAGVAKATSLGTSRDGSGCSATGLCGEPAERRKQLGGNSEACSLSKSSSSSSSSFRTPIPLSSMASSSAACVPMVPPHPPPSSVGSTSGRRPDSQQQGAGVHQQAASLPHSPRESAVQQADPFLLPAPVQVANGSCRALLRGVDDGDAAEHVDSGTSASSRACDELEDAAAAQLTTTYLTGQLEGDARNSDHPYANNALSARQLHQSLAPMRPSSASAIASAPSLPLTAVGSVVCKTSSDDIISNCNGSRVWQQHPQQQQQQRRRTSENQMLDVKHLSVTLASSNDGCSGGLAQAGCRSFNSSRGSSSAGSRQHHHHHHFAALLEPKSRSTPVLACSSTGDDLEAPSQPPIAADAAVASAKLQSAASLGGPTHHQGQPERTEQLLLAAEAGSRRDALQLVKEEDEEGFERDSKQKTPAESKGSSDSSGGADAVYYQQHQHQHQPQQMKRKQQKDSSKAAAAAVEGELDPDARSLMARNEVYERFGTLFEDYRGDKVLGSSFYMAVLLNALLPAVLLGLQPGLGMQPASYPAIAANASVLLVKITFVVYIMVTFPYRNVLFFCVEVACFFLESAICACLVVLSVLGGTPMKTVDRLAASVSSSSKEPAALDSQQGDRHANLTHTLCDAMFLFEIIVLATQVTFLFLRAVVPITVMAAYYAWTTRCGCRRSRGGANKAQAATNAEGTMQPSPEALPERVEAIR